MKKLVITALMALGCLATCSAKETQYKVYDVSMTLKTSKAGGTATTACGSSYVYRVKGARKVQGVIAGCGCLAMAGDETCDNFEMYFWDATTKTQLTNYTFKVELLQRIGKDGKTVEQVLAFTAEDQDGEKFELLLAGFGTYKISKKGVTYDTMSVSGNVAGTLDAPYRVTAGTCGACSSTPGSVDQTTAVAVCEEGVCTASDTGDVTPVHGSYTMKYNAKKAAAVEKNGVSAKTLGLPSYVSL